MTQLNIEHRGRGPSFSPEGIELAWSSTTIKAAETCLRYYQLKVLDGWTPKGRGVHLRFGGHYATALEHFHKHRALGVSYDEAMTLVVREALEDTWDRPACEVCGGEGVINFDHTDQGGIAPCADCEGSGHAGEGKPWQTDHNLKTRETLIRTIVWYLEQFREDSAKPIILSSGQPAVELSVVLPVDNDIVFAAHLDRLVEYADNPYVMDQKTTVSTISSRFFEGFSPDTQMSMYTFLGKATFGVPVKGVIIDAAQIAVGFSRFERGMTMRTPGQLSEWYDDTMHHIQTAQAATREQNFPQNRTACGNYGGCEFREICSRDPGARLAFLKGGFEQGNSYDPLELR